MTPNRVIICHPDLIRYRKIIGIAGLLFLFLALSRFNIIKDCEQTRIKKVLFINPSQHTVSTKGERNDLNSLKYSFFVAGIPYSETCYDKLDSVKPEEFDIVVLPYAAGKNLNSEEAGIIAKAINEGASVIFDGVSKMNEAIDIKVIDKPIYVSQIRDFMFPKDTMYWTDSVLVHTVDNIHKTFNVLCSDVNSRLPVAVSGKFGKGNFIFYSALFDPITDKGYSRFPLLIEYMDKVFGLKALALRKKVEMYYDPGMRDNSISIEKLAQSWRKHNIKTIYAAGWYFDYGYDYETLINSCHANGILVYCWLETPMISKKFWENHPEWREKTATLRDAYVDWRYLMNLDNDNCRNAIFNAFEKFLISYDWDGVDLAELYFEPSPVGPELPENFTPMNDLVRNEFKNISGFDPVLLFDTTSSHYWKTNNPDWKRFASYRKDLCYKLKQSFLDFLTSVQKKRMILKLCLPL